MSAWIADVLGGVQNEKTLKWGFNSLSTFGLLKTYNTKQLVSMLHRLIEAGLVRQRAIQNQEYGRVVELTMAGVSVMKGDVPPPSSLVDIAPVDRPRSRGFANLIQLSNRREKATDRVNIR